MNNKKNKIKSYDTIHDFTNIYYFINNDKWSHKLRKNMMILCTTYNIGNL